jgi:hypothetical protein
MYVRGIVGLTLKDCVFDRPYRNGISVIDTVVRNMPLFWNFLIEYLVICQDRLRTNVTKVDKKEGFSMMHIAQDMLAEDCIFSNSLPNGTGRVSPMAGVDLEPNRPTDRLHNITFRRCKALNNSGAGFQAFPVRMSAATPLDPSPPRSCYDIATLHAMRIQSALQPTILSAMI